jgi:hypothetical protein
MPPEAPPVFPLPLEAPESPLPLSAEAVSPSEEASLEVSTDSGVGSGEGSELGRYTVRL